MAWVVLRKRQVPLRHYDTRIRPALRKWAQDGANGLSVGGFVSSGCEFLGEVRGGSNVAIVISGGLGGCGGWLRGRFGFDFRGRKNELPGGWLFGQTGG